MADLDGVIIRGLAPRIWPLRDSAAWAASFVRNSTHPLLEAWPAMRTPTTSPHTEKYCARWISLRLKSTLLRCTVLATREGSWLRGRGAMPPIPPVADLLATFKVKSEQYEANQKVRKAEIEALKKAIEIIS